VSTGGQSPSDPLSAGVTTLPAQRDADDWIRAVAAVRTLPPTAPILLACHVNPDGDALGSMLGFGLGLRRLGYAAVHASFPGPLEVPEPLRSLPGLDLLVASTAVAPEPHLVVSFDAATPARLGELAPYLDAAPESLVLDHHASNVGFGRINLVDPAAAATAVIAEQLLDRLGVPLDVEIAECLYVALATDTGSFKFDTSTPAVHAFAGRLIATGIPVGAISRRIFDTRPYGAVRLFGEVLGRTELEPRAAGGRGLVWTYATLTDLERHEQRPYVLEALIDSVRCVAEADVACVVKQVRPAEWAVSLRSKGGVDVSRVAVALGGGGHRLAAGFTAYGGLDDVLGALHWQLDLATAQPPE
jgi:bifunctional oligoribonuclease and PAP phosphatase NrnA